MQTLALAKQSYTIIVSDDAVSQWVAERACDGHYDSKTSVSIGLLRGERIVAGAIFNNYNHQSIQLHMAIERMNRAFLAMLAWYAFDCAKAHKVIAPVSASNVRSSRVLEHAGVEFEAVLANACRDTSDLHLYTMTRMYCPFLDPSYISRLESYYGRR